MGAAKLRQKTRNCESYTLTPIPPFQRVSAPWEAEGTFGTLPIYLEMMFSEGTSEACAATTSTILDVLTN